MLGSLDLHGEELWRSKPILAGTQEAETTHNILADFNHMKYLRCTHCVSSSEAEGSGRDILGLNRDLGSLLKMKISRARSDFNGT